MNELMLSIIGGALGIVAGVLILIIFNYFDN